jgi:hypothetical protein
MNVHEEKITYQSCWVFGKRELETFDEDDMIPASPLPSEERPGAKAGFDEFWLPVNQVIRLGPVRSLLFRLSSVRLWFGRFQESNKDDPCIKVPRILEPVVFP